MSQSIRIKNVSAGVIGIDVRGVQYTLQPAATQSFVSSYEDDVQEAIKPFGTDIEFEYVTSSDMAAEAFVSAELELGVDFTSGVEVTIPHGLLSIPTDIIATITELNVAVAGSVAVSLDTAATAALDSAPTISVDSAGSNAQSTVAPVESLIDMYGVTVPTVALVHDADPVVNLAAAPLYAVVDITCTAMVGRLESTQDSTADTTFTTANDGAFYANGTLRATGFVRHAAAPAGVQLFVDEADGYKIKAVNLVDFYIPLYMGGVWVDLQVTGVADTSGMKELYYDDNGADNAKLVFVATDTSNHNTGSLVGHVQQAGYADKQRLGTAAAQAHTDATYTSNTPTISVTDAVYTAALTGTGVDTSIVQSTPADDTNIYLTITTTASALKIKVMAI
jgi:hypothetical protein